MINATMAIWFLLQGCSEVWELQIVHGVLFLVVYLAVLMSNLLIITLITLDLQLQTPMYFFLKNLSLLDVFLMSVPIPKFIVNSLTHNNSISILGCAFQLLLMTSFTAGEIFVLTAMSYDRYVAICCPLHYEVLMSGGTCALMADVSWVTGGLFGVVYTAATFSMPFCGSSVIPQFFCDISSLLRMSCSETSKIVYVSIGLGTCLGMSCFICIMIPYVYIFSSVLTGSDHLLTGMILLKEICCFTGFLGKLSPPSVTPGIPLPPRAFPPFPPCRLGALTQFPCSPCEAPLRTSAPPSPFPRRHILSCCSPDRHLSSGPLFTRGLSGTQRHSPGGPTSV
ncbi:olfactory receptor 14A2-like [Manis pentadactyla]|uniref:olfactory receptor 14A2-like n=1 Tax=Manis pentadactyla TaxID=143292 RepID=UPI00255CAFF0|nr:olfactory receptor 14A2-like [Manis pentadactyla]